MQFLIYEEVKCITIIAQMPRREKWKYASQKVIILHGKGFNVTQR